MFVLQCRGGGGSSPPAPGITGVTGSGEILLIGDFGISKQLGSTLGMAATRVGTPFYLSPELCQGKPYNAKSDIWSLGCILYELCCLKHAFDGQSMQHLTLRIIRGEYSPIPAHYSPELTALVAALLHPAAHKRPSINRILRFSFIQCKVRV